MNNFFVKAIKGASNLAIIAEIKLASPSEGNLGSQKDIAKRVKAYEDAGASAISVVVEKKRFKGDPALVSYIKKRTNLPVLMKDFILHSDQIFEASKYKPDALLLIARIVDEDTLKKFVDLCLAQDIEPIVEIFNQEDLQKAVQTKTRIIAVNARDLNTFTVDVQKACELLQKIPSRFIQLGFSGVKSKKEIEMYKKAGARGVLIGTSLMRAKNSVMFFHSLQSIGVKICATRSLKAAQIAAKEGAEFLGLVFTPHIRTHTVDMAVAKEIGKKMKGKIQLVGVFQNMPLTVVQKIIRDCNLDYAQFHGDESPEYLRQIKIKKIKAFRFAGDFDLEYARKQMKKFDVAYYLVDRIKQSEGPMLNLEKVSLLAKEFPLIFAGGLQSENVREVMHKVKPLIVDVASGVETDGEQDVGKIREFIRNAKKSVILGRSNATTPESQKDSGRTPLARMTKKREETL